MYYLTTLLIAILSGLHVLAQTASSLSWDKNYSDGGLSLDSVACSNGVNGLRTRYPQYTTLGALPSYPNVTAVYTVEGWNSLQCGACYAVTYAGTTVNLLAVDKALNGFVASQGAMDFLTHNQAVALGKVDVTYVQVPVTWCGLN